MLGWKESQVVMVIKNRLIEHILDNAEESDQEEKRKKKFSSPSFAYWRLLLMSIKLFDLSNVCFFFYVQMYCAQFLYLFTDLNSPQDNVLANSCIKGNN
ncbi:hypothetical protein D917_09914 [Trichinella nativa]|uniref:Uncharacterized protein n=1 Tax=Trichinella nativa TaxID=6335 RepID=A0A1Y3EHA8_9BILA|nr:hypothetical protein D917_09914 [Trichinella nativa]